MTEKRPLLCRLGLHRNWYLDCAAFTSALRCGKCGTWQNPVEGALVDGERQTWSDARTRPQMERLFRIRHHLADKTDRDLGP